MLFTNPVPRLGMPKRHEASALRSLQDKDAVGRTWKKDRELSEMVDSLRTAVFLINSEVQKMRRRVVGGSGGGAVGWDWASPKIELQDPGVKGYPAYQKGNVIHIQSDRDIITAGIRNAADPGGPLVTSKAGMWVALQDVPAQKTVTGNPVWNLPQLPLPDPTDLDNKLNFWVMLGASASCDETGAPI